MFKEITKNFGIYSALIILLGYFNLSSYYRNFNIEIFNYLTNFEIILSFIPIVTGILWVLTLIFGVYFILDFSGLNLMNEFLSSKEMTKDSLETIRRSRLIIFLNRFVIGYIIVIFFIPNLIIILPKISRLIILTFFMFSLVISLGFIFYRKLQKAEIFKTNQRTVAQILFFILISYISGQNNNYEGFHVKEYGTDHYAEFCYNNIDTVKSNESHYFIGQTKDFVFFYEPKDTLSHVYEKENITNFKIKPLKKKSKFIVNIPFTKKEIFSFSIYLQ